MKKKVITIVAFLIGVFSVTVSFNGFFFTTKFYDNPMSAYNADAVYDSVYGKTNVKKTIGTFRIDEEKALFIGELTKNRFLVAEMNVKNNKYAYEGTVYFYDYAEEFDAKNYNKIKTKTNYKKWIIAYDKQDIERISNIKFEKEYSLSNGSMLYLVIF